jgi:solute carrier family 35 (UDP-sugar transporter), member A1/2/3
VFWESPQSSGTIVSGLLRNFGGWAWATVSIQVLGGLITALVIKYSDNIMKGFATSLSIVLSFLASVALFGFRITPSFVIGSTTVLAATWMYNQPPGKELPVISRPKDFNSYPITPVSPNAPILGQFSRQQNSSPSRSPRIIASALGVANEKSDSEFGQTMNTPKYLSAPYGSPFSSRTPSPSPTPPHLPSSSQGSLDMNETASRQ